MAISQEAMEPVECQVCLSPMNQADRYLVYGPMFPDENFILNHTRAGLVQSVLLLPTPEANIHSQIMEETPMYRPSL